VLEAPLLGMVAFRPAITEVLEHVGWEHTLLRKTMRIVLTDNIAINQTVTVESVSSTLSGSPRRLATMSFVLSAFDHI